MKNARDNVEASTVLSRPSAEELFRAYYREIERYLARRVSNHETAEDLAQEVFYRACKAVPHLRAPLNARAWLYRIAVNVLNDYLRRLRMISWQSLDEWEEEREMEYPDLVGADPAERVVDGDCVQAALLQLSEGYRRALLLTACEGYTPLQVAEAVGIATSGEKMYLSRARKCFRRHYQQESVG